ncbi:aldehyde dehydrogenase (NADP(+)) [Agrococcus lahaulensis]|uniref:aldehyde dehydrogenase (NADP(+)) n=1 Tax=Agrococcus sp. SCSIO52902 TaxID=2933290 RepID=UPI000FE3DAA7|nr:aldehyde dehydrogenase (NADP(+)) [Agrococcus sp. SCSIO52902]RWR24774.1 aldehyde dehydrogenase (NADP(+)) [Agrococcus lahaulensis]UOW01958.1 aldehyde dehydrogenase (NADP(+)) [Agrococcus sp. SCSIO52902]
MTEIDIDAVAARAEAAARPFAGTAPRERAAALTAVADALDAAAPRLIEIAMRETGLTEARLTGEVRRTSNQLRLFAETIVDGSYLDARIDAPDPDYVIGPRPDVRRVLEPVGPVLNFAASNFPFAFSVAGGDSAAALAAGCPLIVKAHSGHLELSRATAEVVERALVEAGMPDGVFQLIEGQANGTAMLEHPAIRAAAFTGSGRVGRMLADIAAARPRPIPFYGELGSVNPAYATAGAVRAEPDLLAGFVASVAGSAGQLCTKPGFLFVPSDADLGEVSRAATGLPEHRLLNPGIGRAFEGRRAEVLSAEGVHVLAEGELRVDDDEQRWATPTIVEVSASDLEAAGDALLEESFGPLSVIVRYDDLDELPALHERLFPGNLTSTVHATDDEADAVRPLVDALSETSGRVLFGGWPTGVSVTSAMQHGGPYPATTTDATSVGTAAITRFLRGVAYQNAPQSLLPEPLQDANPWGVPQRRGEAGLSSGWGSLQGRY